MSIRSEIAAFSALILSAGPALAHPGHLGDSGSGHTHWLALAALAGAVGVGLVAWRRRLAARRRAARDPVA